MIHAAETQKVKDKLIEIYVKHTGRSAEQIDETLELIEEATAA